MFKSTLTHLNFIIKSISQAEGLVLESQPGQIKVVKTGSDSSTDKRSAIVVSVTGPQNDHYKRMSRVTVSVAAKESSLLNVHQCRAQSFTIYRDVFILMNNSRVRRQTPNLSH